MPATYEPIASQTVGSGGVATVTFSSIAATWTDLLIVAQGKTEAAGSGISNFRVQFNSDTGSNYSLTALYGDGSVAQSDRATSATSANIGNLPQASNTNIVPGIVMAHVMSYANTNVFKTVLSAWPTGAFVGRTVSLWRSTSAIDTISLFVPSADIDAGTTVSLYGIKASA